MLHFLGILKKASQNKAVTNFVSNVHSYIDSFGKIQQNVCELHIK